MKLSSLKGYDPDIIPTSELTPRLAYADVKAHHSCGGGVLFFPWGTHQLAYSQYGPKS